MLLIAVIQFQTTILSSPEEVKDRNVQELRVAAVAGVFTKIISTKRINSTQIITQVDSVRCTTGGANTFTVVF